MPEVIVDRDVSLIYIGNLLNYILGKIDDVATCYKSRIERDPVPYDFIKKVTEVLQLLKQFKSLYFDQGVIPEFQDINEVNLFNTFHSYIDHRNYYPRKTCQFSFSISSSGETLNNNYHTRKIERFTVLKGKARIQLRKIGTEEILDFYLD